MGRSQDKKFVRLLQKITKKIEKKERKSRYDEVDGILEDESDQFEMNMEQHLGFRNMKYFMSGHQLGSKWIKSEQYAPDKNAQICKSFYDQVLQEEVQLLYHGSGGYKENSHEFKVVKSLLKTIMQDYLDKSKAESRIQF